MERERGRDGEGEWMGKEGGWREREDKKEV